MAKLTAPLLSLAARGAIGQTLVYFPWKGIQAVRVYVIPANPRSTLQIAQRAYMTNAVGFWHAANYTAADRIAWNRWAGTLAATMSGFNAMIRQWITSAIDLWAWNMVSDVRVNTPTAVGFDVDVENSLVGLTLRAAIGTSRTFFPTGVALVDDADGTYSLTWAAGQADTDYYVKIEQQSAGVWHQIAGIYHVRTS